MARNKADPDPSKPLDNPRHELYAQLLITGITQEKAYLKAGFSKNKSSQDNACRLAGQADIKARVDYLKLESAEKLTSSYAVTAIGVWKQGDELIKKAIKDGDNEIAARMIEFQHKCLGLDDPFYSRRAMLGEDPIIEEQKSTASEAQEKIQDNANVSFLSNARRKVVQTG